MANYDLTYEGSEVQKILDTGDELQTAGYIFRGEATPSTVPGTPTERVAYIGGPGTYTNFGSSITVGAGCICVFKYTGSAWSNQVINTGLSDAISSEATTRSEADTALQNAITAINNNIGNGYVYAGVATPSTSPVTGKVFYLAVQAGTYTNFGNAVVTSGLNVIKYNGSAWSVDQFIAIDAEPTQGSTNLVKSGGVLNSIIQNGPAFDLSAYNAQGGTLATYADLSAALTALNALPADFKKGGMSMKYVQTSDNKYVQYFCNAQTFTINVSYWEKVNLEKEVEEINIDTGKITIVKDYENDGSVSYIPCSIKKDKTYKVSLTMLEAGNFWAVSLTSTTMASSVDNMTVRGDYAAGENKEFTFTATGDANYIAVRNGSGQTLFSYKINIITENTFSKPLNEQIQDLRSDVDTIDINLDSISEDVNDINEVLAISGGEEVIEINVTDGTMWHQVALTAGQGYTIKITTTSQETLRLIGATAESLSNVTEEFFREDFVANQEKTIRFTPTLNCAYIAFVRINSASVYKWSGILYTTLTSNIDVLSKNIATDKNDKASIIPKTLVFTYDSNSKSGKLKAHAGYVYCIQFAVDTSFYDADNNKLAATALRANCAYLAPVNTYYIEYTGVAGHAGSTFCVAVVPFNDYDDDLFNQYWKRVVSGNGSISTVNYVNTISNLLAGDSESTAVKNQVNLKAFDFACYGGQRTSFIASNCNKGNTGSGITWQILKDNNAIVIDGTNNPSNWTVEPAYYMEMVYKLKSLGAKNIYALSKFVGKGVNVADVIANDKTYNAQKAFFGDKFVDVLGYMASCGVFLNHYFAEPFTQPAVGSNVTIEVEDVSAFTEVGLFAANQNFIIRYTDINDDSADGNKYDEYQCVSIDASNNQITAKLVTNNGVPVGDTAGKYETTRDTGASSGTYTVNGYIYRAVDEEAVGLGYLPHFLFTDNIHVGKIACRIVETMLKIRNII